MGAEGPRWNEARTVIHMVVYWTEGRFNGEFIARDPSGEHLFRAQAQGFGDKTERVEKWLEKKLGDTEIIFTHTKDNPDQ